MTRTGKISLDSALTTAVAAARAAGALMRANLRARKRVNAATDHDIKLELDVKCQRAIERILRRAHPGIPILGEEGVKGDIAAAARWVVDPIDGTVNYSFGIPHACSCVALQVRSDSPESVRYDGYLTVVGVVYDPFMDELWTAVRGRRARLNGKPIWVGNHSKLRDALVAIGLGKTSPEVEANLPYFSKVSRLALKTRIMGSAGLGLAYVATGRFDAYIERGINIWDIAAGGLILECAGGVFWTQPTPRTNFYRMIATNPALFKQLPPLE